MSAATITTISTAELAQRFTDDVGLHVWNVLTDDWFKGELIPGSRRVPGDRLGEAVRRSTLAKDAAIVVYCAGPSCPAEPPGGREAGRLRLHARRGLRGRPRGMEAGRLRRRRHRHRGLSEAQTMWNDTAFTRRFERPLSDRAGPVRRRPVVAAPGRDGVRRRRARLVRRAGDDAGSHPRRRRGDPRADRRAVRREPVGLDRGRARRGRVPRRLRRGGRGAGAVLRRARHRRRRRFRRAAGPVLRGPGGRADRGAAADLQLHLRRAAAGDPRPVSIARASAPSARRRPSTRRARSMRPASTRSSRPAPRPAAIARRSCGRRRRR